AHPSLWGMRTGPSIGFDFQNAFYQRGIKWIFGIKKFRFLFLVQENKAPYCISVLEVASEALQREMVNVKQAIGIWRQCMTSGNWPGYPGEVITVNPRSRITPDAYELEEMSYV
ncbi:MAG: PD-(D/E)XK nuclease-like domain-containing protein, partial [Geminicoccaceae bacterium]